MDLILVMISELLEKPTGAVKDLFGTELVSCNYKAMQEHQLTLNALLVNQRLVTVVLAKNLLLDGKVPLCKKLVKKRGA